MNAVKLLGSLLGNNATGGNMLGSLLKGAMGGGQQQQSGGGGALGMLSGLLGGGGGGGQQSGGGPLGMLSGILGGGSAPSGGGGGGPLGMLSGLFGGGGSDAAPAAPAAPPAAAQDQATLLIRAMCNAAKADGQIDQSEQDNIIGRLGGDLDQGEEAFLRQELASPLDVGSFARSIPSEMAANVYAFSVMTVKVDTREEVAYLQDLAQGLNLDNSTLSSIHKELGLS